MTSRAAGAFARAPLVPFIRVEELQDGEGPVSLIDLLVHHRDARVRAESAGHVSRTSEAGHSSLSSLPNQRGKLREGGMIAGARRKARNSHHVDRIRKSLRRSRPSPRARPALPSLSLTTTAATSRLRRTSTSSDGQGVADGADIAPRHQDDRDAQHRHPVQHGAAIVERHHDAADALDQEHAAAAAPSNGGKIRPPPGMRSRGPRVSPPCAGKAAP